MFLIRTDMLNDEAMQGPLDKFIAKALRNMHMKSETTWPRRSKKHDINDKFTFTLT